MAIARRLSRNAAGGKREVRSAGWGTWIRTKTGGVRVRCPTVRRSPTRALCGGQGFAAQGERGRLAVLAAGAPDWQGLGEGAKDFAHVQVRNAQAACGATNSQIL